MDVNGDGNIDLLSGSYSRMEDSMAGLFHVLWGTEEGGFRAAETLTGTDGEPLVMPGDGSEDADIDRICTRPTAADLNGDGHLDIVSGNFAGGFMLFEGTGEGRFSPEAIPLPAERDVSVDMHSDPFLIDWDNDGDLDLLSGSSTGGAFLAPNVGDAKNPSFGKLVELLKPSDSQWTPVSAPEARSEPSGSTRVFATDYDRDGKLDLLIGDAFQVQRPVEGVSAEEMKTRLAEIAAEQAAWEAEFDMDWEDPSEEQLAAFDEGFSKFEELRAEVAVQFGGGSVWLLRQS